jgi:hypothetical protein
MTTEVETSVQFNELSGKVLVTRSLPSEGIQKGQEVDPAEVWVAVEFLKYFRVMAEDMMQDPKYQSDTDRYLMKQEKRLTFFSTHNQIPEGVTL